MPPVKLKKILFADDQIPPDNIAFNSIEAEMKTLYPDAQQGYIDGFSGMRLAVKTLSDAGYSDIKTARTAIDAMALAKNEKFDLAIIDLRWKTTVFLKVNATLTVGQSAMKLIKRIRMASAKLPRKLSIQAESEKNHQ